MAFINQKHIAKDTIERREYQKKVSEIVKKGDNLLVVAPTALGKTIIAVLSIAHFLDSDKKIVFLAPTKPLVEQHKVSMEKFLNLDKFEKKDDFELISAITGEVSQKKREEIWKNSKIICCTPQTMLSDLKAKRINSKYFSFAVFDEAHRAVSNYSYVEISKMLFKSKANVLALTASPGYSKEKIHEIMENLSISKVEIFQREDDDVRDYVNQVSVEWQRVNLPGELQDVSGLIRIFYDEKLEDLKKIGLIIGSIKRYYKRGELLELQRKISSMINSKKSSYLYNAASKCAALLKAGHALQLVETQGLDTFLNYMLKMKDAMIKGTAKMSDKLFISDKRVAKALVIAKQAKEDGLIHPKLNRLIELLQNEFDNDKELTVIVFNHFRESVSVLERELNKVEGINAKRFVGQATKGKNIGLTQKKQKEILEKFREKKFNVLIATSVAEEGLDIPSCDLVIFYEPVPSEIRHIQRSGRTGRAKQGRAIILMTNNTMDEAFFYTAKRKEKSMQKNLHEIRDDESRPVKQTSLSLFDKEDKTLRIFADTRERNSQVINELKKKDVQIIEKQMDIGDYILSDEVGVERKSVNDFLNSLTNGRLFNQLMNMATSFERPLILLEGLPEELYTKRNIHRNAIIGALSSIALKFQIPIIYTKDEYETAEFLYIIAKREQLNNEKSASLRVGKKKLSFPEQQRFIVESFPSVGPKLAKQLLEEFQTIKNIANATEKNLELVEKIGKKKAEQIYKLLNKKYSK